MPHVVIVDDRATNRNIYARLAATVGSDLDVRTFGDPREALASLVERTPDLVVTDYKMPGMSGADFIRELRQIPGLAEVPVVVITVYEERNFRLQALEAGATDFLHSPVDHAEFVTRARNLLMLRKHQLMLAERAETLARKLADSEKSRAQAIRDSIERLAQVIDTLPAMIHAVDADGRLVFINACRTKFHDIDPADMVGKPLTVFLDEDGSARNSALDRMVFDSGKALPSFEEEMSSAANLRRVFLTTKSPLRDHDGVITAVLTTSLDITANKRAEAHLRRLAHYDPLTDLPNRTLLAEETRRLVARTRRGDQPFALHLLDLDSFKALNDLRGHSAGDRFLKAFARHLAASMRDQDFLARLGGDEFAILQTGVRSSHDAADFANRLATRIAEFADPETGQNVRASIGVAIHPVDGIDAEELLKNADLAMYRAKADVRSAFCLFAADMETRMRQTAALDRDLRDALARKEFVIYLQPQFDVARGHIIGAEALLRWNRPGHGLVAPGVFLPLAEENGLIIPINEWVMQTACAEVKRWQEAGLGHLRIAINMSPTQFDRTRVPDILKQIVGDLGIDPRALVLELTESIVLSNIDAAAADLAEIRTFGASVSIDDFGTGHASLTWLKHLPVDQIKIDQSFVRNLEGAPDDAAIVRMLINLAHSRSLEVVAEGVETAEQLKLLRLERCDLAQGFYLGRPMNTDSFFALVSPARAKRA